MLEKLKNYPWYCVLCIPFYILTSILTPIFEEIVIVAFFDEKSVKQFFDREVNFRELIPWVVGIATLIICVVVYVVKLLRRNNISVVSDELAKLNIALKKSLDNHECVDSIQAFQYYVSTEKDMSVFKLNYLTGHAKEQIEINAIMQSYFRIPISIHSSIKQISSRYDHYLQEEDRLSKEDYYKEFQEKGLQLCNTLRSELNGISAVNDVNERHSDLYLVLSCLLPAISGKDILSFLKIKDVENKLLTIKRNGVFGALIINKAYIFNNINSPTKNNRIYFTFLHNKRKRIILLCSPRASIGKTAVSDRMRMVSQP